MAYLYIALYFLAISCHKTGSGKNLNPFISGEGYFLKTFVLNIPHISYLHPYLKTISKSFDSRESFINFLSIALLRSSSKHRHVTPLNFYKKECLKLCYEKFLGTHFYISIFSYLYLHTYDRLVTYLILYLSIYIHLLQSLYLFL